MTEGTENVEPQGETPAEEPRQQEPVADAAVPDAPQVAGETVPPEPPAPAPSFEQPSLLDEAATPEAIEATLLEEAVADAEDTAADETAAADATSEEPEGEPAATTETAPETGDAVGEAGDADDVSAAIAAAGANLEQEATLDDIAPGTVVAEEAAAVVEGATGRNAVSIWPFVVYDVLWAAFAGYLVWQFEQLPKTTAVFDADIYPYAVLGGVVLTIAGPLLILAVWIASWGKPGSTKGGLFVSSLVKGSIATLLGVLMWWGALMVLDQIRLGRLL